MKLFKYLISAILLLGIFSCEEYGEINGVLDTLPRKLTLDKASVEFVEVENSLTREVVVASENISWAITGVPDWLEVSPLEGGSGTTAVKLTASKLPVGDKRNAVIKLESLVPKFKYSHEIKVSQGVDLEFGISATLLSFENTAGEKSIAVTTNALWEAECDASWVTFEKNGDMSLTVSVEENETFEERTATITLKKEGTEDVLGSVSVKQSKATFELQPVSLEFGNTSSNKTVAVTTNISWAAECDA
ncbi:MAG: BACON domain-containing protein, partial [Bacteroidaceae bacterium]|nr:BACON domain-containing protein [Bacteroidaceae bacterium]